MSWSPWWFCLFKHKSHAGGQHFVLNTLHCSFFSLNVNRVFVNVDLISVLMNTAADKMKQNQFLLSHLENNYSSGIWSSFSLRATPSSARGGEFCLSKQILVFLSTFLLTVVSEILTIHDTGSKHRSRAHAVTGTTNMQICVFVKDWKDSHMLTSSEFMSHMFPPPPSQFLFCFRVSEKKTLEEILTPYIHPSESDPVTRQK